MEMELIRVLHVVTYMGRGGLETMLMNYYRHIDRTRLQFDFLVHRDFEADYDSEILALGGRIYHLPVLNPFSRSYRKALDDFFKAHKEYKIVHSHLDCMAGIPLAAAKKNGVPVRIAHAHNSSQARDLKYPLKLLFKRNIPRSATELFACSREAGMWMFGSCEFQILNNAIDAAQYRPNHEVRKQKRRELGIAEDAFVVGHVGRFAPQKNHDFLLDVFAELCGRCSEAFLLLIGDGELMPRMQKKATALGIEDKICFTGVRADVAQLLQAMDVFCFPSLFEGLPVSIIEAQAAGLPCLISERVPSECIKTSIVRIADLESGAGQWADGLLACRESCRSDTLADIQAAGFDVRTNVNRLTDYYIRQYRSN